ALPFRLPPTRVSSACARNARRRVDASTPPCTDTQALAKSVREPHRRCRRQRRTDQLIGVVSRIVQLFWLIYQWIEQPHTRAGIHEKRCYVCRCAQYVTERLMRLRRRWQQHQRESLPSLPRQPVVGGGLRSERASHQWEAGN